MIVAKRSKKEIDVIVARMNFLRDLLKEFGATLGGYDPGVLAYLPNPHRAGYVSASMDFSRAEWNWIEPLLVELRELRAKAVSPAGGIPVTLKRSAQS